jgi:hypothetical protein
VSRKEEITQAALQNVQFSSIYIVFLAAVYLGIIWHLDMQVCFLVSCGGVRVSPLSTSATISSIVATQDNGWNEWQRKPKYLEKTCRNAALSATNPTWPDLGWNLGHRGGKPATDCMKLGNSFLVRFEVFTASGIRRYVIWSIFATFRSKVLPPSSGSKSKSNQSSKLQFIGHVVTQIVCMTIL